MANFTAEYSTINRVQANDKYLCRKSNTDLKKKMMNIREINSTLVILKNNLYSCTTEKPRKPKIVGYLK